MATLQCGTLVLTRPQIDAFERAARALPEKWRVVIVGDVRPDGGFDVTVEGPGIFAVRTFRDGDLDSALSFVEDVGQRRRGL